MFSEEEYGHLNFDPGWRARNHRAVEKAYSTHVVWIATPNFNDYSGRDIIEIESELIAEIEPNGNRQRPEPNGSKRNDASVVLEEYHKVVNSWFDRFTLETYQMTEKGFHAHLSWLDENRSG